MNEDIKNVSVYSLFDSSLKVHYSCTCDIDDLEFKKKIRELGISKNTYIGMFPEKYTLVRVGEFNITTGEITPCYVELGTVADLLEV